jgi:hypothetical protein
MWPERHCAFADSGQSRLKRDMAVQVTGSATRYGLNSDASFNTKCIPQSRPMPQPISLS